MSGVLSGHPGKGIRLDTGDIMERSLVRNYPLRLYGTLDSHLSRWLWLVKWILAIPHYIVLAILWVVFLIVTIAAFFAILFTGRFPAGLFDFNVGVLRWSWRVTFYAFVLGTDRYPPFHLSSDPGYPADLFVAYPERLSRGLVLVKWWLLAIPHYLVVWALTRGVTFWYYEGADSYPGGEHVQQAGISLIGLLALFAGVVLLSRAFYPQGIFDLVMGVERWVYRVSAYVFLMRDDYPPFRLDQGGTDPGGEPQASSGQASTPPPAA
jgi:Domain of unknown function (DUF4389)